MKQAKGNATLKDDMYYVHPDHLGSLAIITDAGGNVKQKCTFDAWGSRTFITKDPTLIFDRGYTGHEHLPEFGLINMNGRMYDPMVGRFLSPDPYVQMPEFSQSFNRYSYALNNPLLYIDPDGELLDLALFIIGSGILKAIFDGQDSHGNWDWKNAGKGFVEGAFMAYSMVSSYGLYMFNQFMPSWNIPIGNSNWSLDISPGIGAGPNGFSLGLNIWGIYDDGTTQFSVGGGIGSNTFSYGASYKYKGYGAGFYMTKYGDAGSLYENSQSNAQTLGGRTLYFNHNSFSIQNDYWGDKKDRWRTNAWELTVGKYSVGASVYTNDGNAESKIVDRLKKSPIWGLNRPHHEGSELGGWDKGYVYSSPLWIGFRAGSIVTRMGYSHRSFQDFQQNGIHKWYRFGRQNYYADYEKFRHGLYYYTGYYNPFSLY